MHDFYFCAGITVGIVAGLILAYKVPKVLKWVKEGEKRIAECACDQMEKMTEETKTATKKTK